MNRILLSLVLAASAYSASAQTPAAPTPVPPKSVTEHSQITRFVAGPGDRPQGFLLQNGTFVILPPGLSERMPSTIRSATPITVAGDEFTYAGSRTIHAQRVEVGGNVYESLAPPIPARPAPPAPHAGPRAAGIVAPPPCPAVSAAAPPVPSSAPRPPAPPAGAAPPPTPPAPPAQ